MSLESKTFRFKANLDNEEEGTVHAIVSVFGNKDSDGDVVVKGAFARDIKAAKDRGKFPIGVWNHDLRTPVALTKDAWEDDEGLHVIGVFNLDTQAGRETYSNIKKGIIDEFSFGFRVREREHKNGTRFIKDVYWAEWSPVVIAANRATRAVAVKDQSPKIEFDDCVSFLSRKMEFLGWADRQIAMAGFRVLNDAIYYEVMCSICYGDTPIEERRAKLEGALQEYSALAMKVFDNLASMEESEPPAEADTMEGMGNTSPTDQKDQDDQKVKESANREYLRFLSSTAKLNGVEID